MLEFVVRRSPVGAGTAGGTVADHHRPARAASRAVLGEDVTAFRWVRDSSATVDILGGEYLDVGVVPFQCRLCV